MNEQIKQLMVRADYPAPDIAGRAQMLTKLILQDVLDALAQHNINACAKTTYEQGLVECTRAELIKGIQRRYAVDYSPTLARPEPFPVKGVKL